MEYSQFQHNNLNTNNIYVYRKNTTNAEYNGYYNDTFCTTNSDIDLKIGNFEKSFIPNQYGQYDRNISPNIYYDVYIYFY